jgi:hypothetical protein
MPNLDWNAILVELGRTNFHFPDLERFNFLMNVYRAAGKASAFNLKTLLEWEDFTARYSAVRILIRVSKDLFDVLQQSEGLVLSVNDFAASGPLVKEKAQYLATQNLNSLELCHVFFLLNNFNEDPQAIAFLREEFRNNVELLTLAGSILPVYCVLKLSLMNRSRGQLQLRLTFLVGFSISSELKEHINSSSLVHIKSPPHS